MRRILEILASSLSLTWQEFRSHKVRTLLSLSGVAFGIFCIIGVLAMVDSLELVKVKINPNSFEDEETAARALCASVAGLEHVWTIGHTMLFFRASRTRDTRYPLPS